MEKVFQDFSPYVFSNIKSLSEIFWIQKRFEDPRKDLR